MSTSKDRRRDNSSEERRKPTAPPQRTPTGEYAAWRVLWAESKPTDQDWIARRLDGRMAKRKKPPPTHSKDFFTREGAESFAAKRRDLWPGHDLVIQFASMRNLVPALPRDHLLPGFRPTRQKGKPRDG